MMRSTVLLTISIHLLQAFGTVYSFTISNQHLMITNNGGTTGTSTSMNMNAKQSAKGDQNDTMQYKNIATSVLSNFMQSNNKPIDDTTIINNTTTDENNDSANNYNTDNPYANNPVSSKINFNAPKFPKVPIKTLASILDAELYSKQWFVTGNVNPIYFDESFEFQDPDVQLKGIDKYAEGVNKLFNQQLSKAEIISTVVNPEKEDTITVTWRLSGKVNIGPGDGLTIKPYICYTDLKVDTEGNGLIVFQEDRFDIPQWDILLSALFPFLIGKVTSEPAPPVPEREVPVMPKLNLNNVNGGMNTLTGTRVNSGFDFKDIFGQIFQK